MARSLARFQDSRAMIFAQGVNRMKARHSTILLLILLAASVAVAQKVNIDWDRGTDFSKFHTYAWQTSPDPAKGLWPQRVIDGVNTQLQAKGFKLVESNPDLWLV